MADSPGSRPLVVMRGLLSISSIRQGTGSEQQALVLEAADAGRLVLIKLDGPSFGLPAEATLAGCEVEAWGYLLGNELRFTQLTPI